MASTLGSGTLTWLFALPAFFTVSRPFQALVPTSVES